MMINPERLREIESAEAGDFGTGSNGEILADFNGSMSEIIARKWILSSELFLGRCDICCEAEVRLYSEKGRSAKVCSDCLLGTPKPKAPAAEEIVTVKSSPVGRTFRLYRCFECDNAFAAGSMSSALVLCKNCLFSIRLRAYGRSDRAIEKFLLKIGAHLRRCI